MLGTFRGILGLSATYNEAWHNEVEVRYLLDRCNELVVNNLLAPR